jgi:hypothetical protein
MTLEFMRYKTNTGRLTTAMFEDVVSKAKGLAQAG